MSHCQAIPLKSFTYSLVTVLSVLTTSIWLRQTYPSSLSCRSINDLSYLLNRNSIGHPILLLISSNGIQELEYPPVKVNSCTQAFALSQTNTVSSLSVSTLTGCMSLSMPINFPLNFHKSLSSFPSYASRALLEAATRSRLVELTTQAMSITLHNWVCVTWQPSSGLDGLSRSFQWTFRGLNRRSSKHRRDESEPEHMFPTSHSPRLQ